ncbi:hypothetical protein, partial [Marinilabilia sp.]
MIRKALIIASILLILLLNSCGHSNPFWGNGEPVFFQNTLFEQGRFPNIVVAKDGSVVSSWGNDKYFVRRSSDGGQTWEPANMIADPGFHGGGLTVDEQSGDLLAFVEEHHPIAPIHLFRSKDNGQSWQE